MRRLSFARRPITRGPVLHRTTPLPDRLIAALCALLMMVYAAAMPARAAHQIQHGPTVMIEHDHSAADDFSLEAVDDHHGAHADHHDDAPDGDNEPGDNLAGGHHHHGDSGPNLLVPNATAAGAMAASPRLHGFEKDRPIAGLRSIGPERPPRTTPLTA